MGTISLQQPIVGQPDTTEDVKIQNNFTTIQTWANGSIDGVNLTPAAAQAAGMNQAGQTVKGAVNIPGSEARTNVAYGTLATPDQVTGIVLPANGLIRVWYQAQWQESVAGAARAAIFLNSTQLQTSAGGPWTLAAATGAGTANTNRLLSTWAAGLCSSGLAAGGSDLTTGQVVGVASNQDGGLAYELSGTVFATPFNASGLVIDVRGGACDIFAAAGTYTVSVQFKASSGTVTAASRRLWVQALAFS